MDKKLNPAIKFLAIILCLTAFSLTAIAQKKKTTTKKPTTTKTTPVSATANAADVKFGAEKVSTQIKNISKFIFVLGGVAKDIEAIDADIRARKITRQTTIDQNGKNKEAVVQAIRNLRAGLIALEDEFRMKAGLKLYAVRVVGISTTVAEAESQAAGGQLTESGKTLLLVLERLSDALAALP